MADKRNFFTWQAARRVITAVVDNPYDKDNDNYICAIAGMVNAYIKAYNVDCKEAVGIPEPKEEEKVTVAECACVNAKIREVLEAIEDLRLRQDQLRKDVIKVEPIVQVRPDIEAEIIPHIQFEFNNFLPVFQQHIEQKMITIEDTIKRQNVDIAVVQQGIDILQGIVENIKDMQGWNKKDLTTALDGLSLKLNNIQDKVYDISFKLGA